VVVMMDFWSGSSSKVMHSHGGIWKKFRSSVLVMGNDVL